MKTHKSRGNPFPDPKNYIGRGHEKRLETFLSKAIKNHMVSVFHFGGLPGSGVSSSAGHFASEKGCPIWIDVQIYKDVKSIISQIGIILRDDYGRGKLNHILTENHFSETASTLNLPVLEAVADQLSQDIYFICFANFHLVEDNKSVKDLIEKIKSSCESRDSSQFLGFILVSNNRTVIPYAISVDLKGFENLEKTIQFIQVISKEMQIPMLPKEACKILHEKTEGYPGLIQLFLTTLALEYDSIDKTIELLDSIDNKDSFSSAITDYIHKRLDENEPKILSALYLLEQPFTFADGAEFLHAALKTNTNVTLLSLIHKYIVSRDGEYDLYSIHRLINNYYRKYLSKIERENILRNVAGYFMRGEDYLKAAQYYLAAGDLRFAADILVKSENKNKIIKNNNLGLYNQFLYRFKKEQIDDKTWRYLIIRQGDVLEIMSQYDSAIQKYTEALELCKSKDILCKLRIYRRLGWVYQRICKWDDSRKMYLHGLEIVDAFMENSRNRPGDEILVEKSRLKTQLALIYIKLLNYPEAVKIGTEGLEILEKELVEDKYIKHIAQAYLILGLAYHGQGKLLTAQTCLERAVNIYDNVDNTYGKCEANIYLGMVLGETSAHLDMAYQILGTVLVEGEKLGSKKIIADYHRQMGKIEARRGQFDQAITHLRNAIEIHSEIKDVHSEAWSHNTIGNAYAEQGNYSEAKREWEIALSLFDLTNSPKSKNGVQGNLGYLAKKNGDFKTARNYWTAGLTISQRNQDDSWSFLFLANLIELNMLTGSGTKSIKEQLKESEQYISQDQHKLIHQYLLGEYHFEEGRLETAKAPMAHCASEENNQFFVPYFDALLDLTEICLLQGEKEEAQRTIQRVDDYVKTQPSNKMITAKFIRLLGLINLGHNNEAAKEKFEESKKIFSSIGSSLDATDTEYKAGRLLEKLGASIAKEYLLSARDQFQSLNAKARVKRINTLLEK